jgi:hypothetical protein
MTPPDLAKSGTEHAHQRALVAWSQIARRYGFAAADDAKSYTEYGYLCRTYGTNPREEANPSGKSNRWVDDGGIVAVPELEWLHAIPNGGARDGFTAASLKAEGVRRGILDMFLPLPMLHPSSTAAYMYCGLYIEMKRPTSGKGAQRRQKGSTSEEQDAFIAYARGVGYAVSVCFDWLSASREIIKYVEAVRAAR